MTDKPLIVNEDPPPEMPAFQEYTIDQLEAWLNETVGPFDWGIGDALRSLCMDVWMTRTAALLPGRSDWTRKRIDEATARWLHDDNDVRNYGSMILDTLHKLDQEAPGA